MLWAAMTTCFVGCLSSEEITLPSEASFDPATHLCFSDLSIDCIHNPQVVKLRLKASKSDPFRIGVEVVLGRTANHLCPVSALLAYLVVRGNNPCFLFQFANGSLFIKPRFIANIRQLLGAEGIDPSRYAGHSFRIGAATTAGGRGVNDSVIQTLGRWQS